MATDNLTLKSEHPLKYLRPWWAVSRQRAADILDAVKLSVDVPPKVAMDRAVVAKRQLELKDSGVLAVFKDSGIDVDELSKKLNAVIKRASSTVNRILTE